MVKTNPKVDTENEKSYLTVEEFNANNYQDVKDAILTNLQELFEGSDFIIAVNFSEVNVQ